MTLVRQGRVASHRFRDFRGLAALAGSLMLGACSAQLPNPGAPGLVSLNADKGSATKQDPRSELIKATQYWGNAFAENPRDLNAALSYAKNLRALGEKQRALAALQQAAVFHGQSRELASEYGRLALELDQVDVAGRLLAAADDPSNPDWRVISARGTVLAKQGKYRDAIPYYERALTLAHDHPSVLSNLALAHAMSGEPVRAEDMLRQAAAKDPGSLKIRQNLALVLGLQGKYEEAKKVASLDLPPESAAENADYLRRVVKVAPKTQKGEATRTQIARAVAKPAVAGTEGKAEPAGIKAAAPAPLPVPKPVELRRPADKAKPAPVPEFIVSVKEWEPTTWGAPTVIAAKAAR